MFGYLRIFLIVSLIFVVSSAVAGGIFLSSLALDDLVRAVEKNSSSIAQGYVNSVWKRYHDALAPGLADPTKLKDLPKTPYFAQGSVQFFQKMSLLRVNVYNANGQLLVTTNISEAPKLIGAASTPDKSFVMANSKRTGPTSQVLDDVHLSTNELGKLVQTVVPFNSEGAPEKPIEGVVEILFNITDTYDKLMSFQVVSTCIVIFVFLSFLLILSVSSRKAEAIIAKQHEANLELAKTAASAQAENADKSQFLANISHELRTPLNAIIGFSEIIKTELLPTLPERKYDQYVGDIHTSGVHLLSLINDILDFSKAEAGKLALEVSEVDVTKMVQNSMRLVSPRAEAGSVALVDNLPKEHIVMIIDGKKFKQVLLNLLSNAVKFTPAGGQVSVTAWQTLGDDTVTFEVTDTGIGIAPKDISRAMTPFGQVDNTLKRKYEGTGLGLPLTKKFVEIMGGKFSIESELNKGTKIIFTLPREAKEIDGVTIKQAS
jgi:two-component system cell cycle sensor histidine kinase PleC